MTRLLNAFARTEDGAVSADFVVVSAAMVSLGIAVLATLADGVLDTSDALGDEMATEMDISYAPLTD